MCNDDVVEFGAERPAFLSKLQISVAGYLFVAVGFRVNFMITCINAAEHLIWFHPDGLIYTFEFESEVPITYHGRIWTHGKHITSIHSLFTARHGTANILKSCYSSHTHLQSPRLLIESPSSPLSLQESCHRWPQLRVIQPRIVATFAPVQPTTPSIHPHFIVPLLMSFPPPFTKCNG